MTYFDDDVTLYLICFSVDASVSLGEHYYFVLVLGVPLVPKNLKNFEAKSLHQINYSETKLGFIPNISGKKYTITG